MKRLLVILMLILCGCNEADTRLNDSLSKFNSIVVENCIVGGYYNYMCEIKVGNTRYCRTSFMRDAVNVDCKVYDEAKRIMELR